MTNRQQISPPQDAGPPDSVHLTSGVFRIVRAAASRIMAVDRLHRIYLDAAGEDGGRSFPDRILRTMQLRYEVCERDLERIPRKGAVVVVANHPFGGAEGLILASLLGSVRPDAKLMANFLLDRLAELRESCIFVDPFDRPGSGGTNFRPLREALTLLGDGGMLAVFPAGEVSHLRLGNAAVTDPPWSETIARIIRRTEADVLPVYFAGSNSLLFQLAGMLHPRLRTILLPHELYNKRDSMINPRIGNPIRFKKLGRMDDAEMIEYLRARTYHLADRAHSEKRRPKVWKLPLLAAMAPLPLEPLIAPVEPAVLAAEIGGLAPGNLLAAAGELEVFHGTARELPQVLREIGRLREMSFRAVEEGTGSALDIDRFDAAYHHLFVWHRTRREVVGAYRLGRTDEILATIGKKGLYTTTLFKIRKKLLKTIGPALEMGRSFV